VTNTLTILRFYKAVDFSLVTSADIIDITYPIFMAIVPCIILGNQRDVAALHIVDIVWLGFLRPLFL